jgi:hypothetical protein
MRGLGGACGGKEGKGGGREGGREGGRGKGWIQHAYAEPTCPSFYLLSRIV